MTSDWPDNGQIALIDGPVGQLELRYGRPAEAGSTEIGELAVICHPHPLHGGTMSNKVVTTLERLFQGRGLATLCFNFRGVGRSTGDHDDARGEQDDLRAVVAEGLRRLPSARLWLAGFSFGSYVAAAVAQQVRAAGLISVAPPVSKWGFADVGDPGCPWWVLQGAEDEVVDPQAVYDYVARHPAGPQLIRFDGAGHFFHGRLIELRDRLNQALDGHSGD